MKIFRLLTEDTVEERIVDLYQSRKLEIAKLVHEATYFQVGKHKVPVSEKVATAHMDILYEQECMAMVLYDGCVKEIMADGESFVGMEIDDDVVNIEEAVEVQKVSEEGEEVEEVEVEDEEEEVMMVEVRKDEMVDVEDGVGVQDQQQQQQYTLGEHGFHCVQNHPLFASGCFETIAELADFALKTKPLQEWRWITGDYRQMLIMQLGEWSDEVVQAFKRPVLRRFQTNFRKLMVCLLQLHS